MTRAFVVLTWNAFREARRNRITIVIGAFAGFMVLTASLLTEAAVATFERVLVDIGLGMMSVLLALLSVFLSSALVGREIERRTIFLITSKPVSRTTFLLSRLAGNMLTLLFLISVMSLLFFLQVKAYGFTFHQAELVAIVGLFFELLILSSVGLLMSTFSGQIVSIFVTAGMYFAGHFSADVYNLSKKAAGLLKPIGAAIYYALPNLQRLNFRTVATYETSIAAVDLASGAAYAVGYSTILLVIANAILSRRDFK